MRKIFVAMLVCSASCRPVSQESTTPEREPAPEADANKAPTQSVARDSRGGEPVDEPKRADAGPRHWACFAIAYHERPTCPPGAPCHYKSPPTTRDWFRFVGKPAASQLHAAQLARDMVNAENSKRRKQFEAERRVHSSATGPHDEKAAAAQPTLRRLIIEEVTCFDRPEGETFSLPRPGRIPRPLSDKGRTGEPATRPTHP